jgi:hypothetical protein
VLSKMVLNDSSHLVTEGLRDSVYSQSSKVRVTVICSLEVSACTAGDGQEAVDIVGIDVKYVGTTEANFQV